MDVKSQKAVVFDRLFSEMRARGDLPSLQHSSDQLAHSLHREAAKLADLTALVLSDLSLSQKVITLANTAMYRTYGGEVTSVSRAIMVLGVTAVEHLSAGIRMLDHFESGLGNHAVARAGLRRASLASAFTRGMTERHAPMASEEAVLSSMLLQMAPAMLALYFEGEWAEVMAKARAPHGPSLDLACHAVLGVTLTEVGAEIARRFGMPPQLALCMAAELPPPGVHIGAHGQWLSVSATLAAEVVSMIDRRAEPADIERFLLPYLGMLGLDTATMKKALAQVLALADEMAAEDRRLAETASVPAARGFFDLPPYSARRLTTAVSEIHEAASAMGSAAVITWVVEQMGRCLNLKSGFLLLHQAKDNHYAAKIGYGSGVHELLPRLHFDAAFVPDIFHMATSSTVPTFFIDLEDESVAPRVPTWYVGAFPRSGSLICVPVHLRDRCIGLFCGTWGEERVSRTLVGGEIQGLRDFAEEISQSIERSMRR